MAFWNLRGLNSSSSALAASSWDLIWAKLYSFDPGSGVPSPVVVGSFVAWVSLMVSTSFRLTPFLPATSGRANPTVGAPLVGVSTARQRPWVGEGCDEPAAPNARSARIQTVTPGGRSVLGGESQRPKLRSEALTRCLPGRSHD